MKPLDFSATKPLKDVSVLGRALFSPSINLNIKDPLSRFLLFPHRWGVYYGSSFFAKCSCVHHPSGCVCHTPRFVAATRVTPQLHSFVASSLTIFEKNSSN